MPLPVSKALRALSALCFQNEVARFGFADAQCSVGRSPVMIHGYGSFATTREIGLNSDEAVARDTAFAGQQHALLRM